MYTDLHCRSIRKAQKWEVTLMTPVKESSDKCIVRHPTLGWHVLFVRLGKKLHTKIGRIPLIFIHWYSSFVFTHLCHNLILRFITIPPVISDLYFFSTQWETKFNYIEHSNTWTCLKVYIITSSWDRIYWKIGRSVKPILSYTYVILPRVVCALVYHKIAFLPQVNILLHYSI